MKIKLMFLHKKLINEGRYEMAKRLLRFLADHRIKLYNSDTDFALSLMLEKLGVRICCTDRRGYYAEYHY